ncbi:MAG: hypothetical protein LBE12_07045, partial [Planctomycetaceae bacterium]|nr:hypothetical protein [Planctomycetaceae bacterium]
STGSSSEDSGSEDVDNECIILTGTADQNSITGTFQSATKIKIFTDKPTSVEYGTLDTSACQEAGITVNFAPTITIIHVDLMPNLYYRAELSISGSFSASVEDADPCNMGTCNATLPIYIKREDGEIIDTVLASCVMSFNDCTITAQVFVICNSNELIKKRPTPCCPCTAQYSVIITKYPTNDSDVFVTQKGTTITLHSATYDGYMATAVITIVNEQYDVYMYEELIRIAGSNLYPDYPDSQHPHLWLSVQIPSAYGVGTIKCNGLIDYIEGSHNVRLLVSVPNDSDTDS